VRRAVSAKLLFFTVLKKLRKFADFATSLWRDAVTAGAAALLFCPRIIKGVDVCSIYGTGELRACKVSDRLASESAMVSRSEP
jgi:hypothetical protein